MEREKYDFLWKRRVYLLREISVVLGLEDAVPIQILSKAIRVLKNSPDAKQQKLRSLLNSLKTVRSRLFKELRKDFGGIFNRAQAKYAQEGSAILEEKMLQAIDRCQCGKERTFPGYFMKYALKGFSEIEDDRMAGLSVPRKKKLLCRRIRRLEGEATDGSLLVQRTDCVESLAVYDTPETILEAKEEMIQHVQHKKKETCQHNPEIKFWWDLSLNNLSSPPHGEGNGWSG